MPAENPTEQIEIKISKVMTEILTRYGVEVRSAPQLVRHKAYGTETLVSPSVYAVFEAAVKANYVATVMNIYPDVREMLGCMAYFNSLIADDTDLPWISDQMMKNKDTVIQEANQDYYKCSRAIAEAGLYMELLD